MKKILLSALFATAALSAVADEISVSNFSINAGDTAAVEVNLTNTASYVAYQFDLILPSGISVAQQNGTSAVTLHRVSDHAVYSAAISGGYRFVVVSATNAAITGTSGSLMTLPLVADAGISSDQSLSCALQNAEFAISGTSAVQPADANFTASVVTGLEDVVVAGRTFDVYTVGGVKVRSNASDVKGLPLGIYIINGKRVLVK